MQVRRGRFAKKAKTRTARRSDAIYRSTISKKINRLKKIGHFDDQALKELKKQMRQGQ